MFLLGREGRQMPNTEQLLYQTEIFKDTYSEEHLRTAASELTL